LPEPPLLDPQALADIKAKPIAVTRTKTLASSMGKLITWSAALTKQGSGRAPRAIGAKLVRAQRPDRVDEPGDPGVRVLAPHCEHADRLLRERQGMQRKAEAARVASGQA
jgi:hypothetical protein